MLQNIRQSTRSGWTYLLVGLLIVVFAVFFGVPGDACGGSGNTRRIVAKVDGTSIYSDDVGVLFNRWFAGQRRQDDDQLRQQEAQSLRSILLIYLLADKAKEHGLRVSDSELIGYIKDPLKNAEFRQIYGREGFDGPTYQSYVQNQLRISIPRYEDFKRQELLAMKYLNLVEMQFQATPWEREELNALRNTKVDLEFVQFNPEALANFVPITDEQVAEFEAGNAAAIQKYYDDHRSDYETQERVLLRRIFIIKPEESEGADKVKAAIEKWDEAKSTIDADPSKFADVAGELSDSERETQGLMEWTTLDNLDQNIADKIRGVEKGATVEIDTEYAFMLVHVEDREEATKTPLEEVSNAIARTLVQEQSSKKLIDELIAQLLAVASDHETLADAVAALKPAEEEEADSPWDAVSTNTTGEFSLEGQDMSAMFGGQIPGLSSRTPWDRVPKIGQNPDLARDAFKLTTEKPIAEKPYLTNGQYYIVRLSKRIEPSSEETAEDGVSEMDSINAELRADKIRSTLGAYAMVMLMPSADYGPFLENMLSRAIDSGKIKLYARNYDAIPLIMPEDG